MDMRRLTDANEQLKTEIWDLREVATNLDLEKEEIIIEIQSIREQNRGVEAKIDCFKAMVEESRKEEEELQATLLQLEEKFGRLESQNQALEESNRALRMEIQTVSSDVADFQDCRAKQEQDLSSMIQAMESLMGYFWKLKSKVEIAERHYEEARRQVGELSHTLGELEQICEVQENEMVSLQGQLEEASQLEFETGENATAPSLLQEMVQAKLKQDSLAMRDALLVLLPKGLWLLLATFVCVGVVSFSVKFFVFVYGKDSATGRQLSLFLDRTLESLVEVLSLGQSRKPSGLLPY